MKKIRFKKVSTQNNSFLWNSRNIRIQSDFSNFYLLDMDVYKDNEFIAKVYFLTREYNLYIRRYKEIILNKKIIDMYLQHSNQAIRLLTGT